MAIHLIPLSSLAAHLLPPSPGIQNARTLDTATLKALWDSCDGDTTTDPTILAEDVHTALNERGDGYHCAV